jgi:hypothetical protein
MTKKLSARIVPELEKRLSESGLLTAIVTLDSPRFKHYLKKPANLLHDRWTYMERDDASGVLYRLGTDRGIRQELTICRRSRQAILVTYDPRAGRKQTLVFDLKTREVLRNQLVHDSAGVTVTHNFLFLNKREGLLRRSRLEPVAAAS